MFDNLSTSEIIKLFAPLIIIQLGLMIFSIYRLTKDKVRFLPKWAWLIIIVLGEILGPLIFLIIGREKE
ncbi:PLDc N-terminal domain-containing protein [Thermoanaerobacterium sp. RBIITD]|uniref:PLDc N-terminal domain-containing protein n=1 Tax=Thermoanaerobacterium sp. RBIITD TaxID=1550240 RepID=UPI000BB98C90|nr:PLDc N-terminal domain-containing protein [Thermoanaerobacterium sp. RBIITD]SNX53682.1 Phospholipase_D-nuclease N-terminal [Thermoanaerobacterium sp. RBIITD]